MYSTMKYSSLTTLGIVLHHSTALQEPASPCSLQHLQPDAVQQQQQRPSMTAHVCRVLQRKLAATLDSTLARYGLALQAPGPQQKSGAPRNTPRILERACRKERRRRQWLSGPAPTVFGCQGMVEKLFRQRTGILPLLAIRRRGR